MQWRTLQSKALMRDLETFWPSRSLWIDLINNSYGKNHRVYLGWKYPKRLVFKTKGALVCERGTASILFEYDGGSTIS